MAGLPLQKHRSEAATPLLVGEDVKKMSDVTCHAGEPGAHAAAPCCSCDGSCGTSSAGCGSAGEGLLLCDGIRLDWGVQSMFSLSSLLSLSSWAAWLCRCLQCHNTSDPLVSSNEELLNTYRALVPNQPLSCLWRIFPADCGKQRYCWWPLHVLPACMCCYLCRTCTNQY